MKEISWFSLILSSVVIVVTLTVNIYIALNGGVIQAIKFLPFFFIPISLFTISLTELLTGSHLLKGGVRGLLTSANMAMLFMVIIALVFTNLARIDCEMSDSVMCGLSHGIAMLLVISIGVPVIIIVGTIAGFLVRRSNNKLKEELRNIGPGKNIK